MKKLLATIKYYGFRKWLAKLNDPMGAVHYLSGGLAELTQANEYKRYRDYIEGITDKY